MDRNWERNKKCKSNLAIGSMNGKVWWMVHVTCKILTQTNTRIPKWHRQSAMLTYRHIENDLCSIKMCKPSKTLEVQMIFGGVFFFLSFSIYSKHVMDHKRFFRNQWIHTILLFLFHITDILDCKNWKHEIFLNRIHLRLSLQNKIISGELLLGNRWSIMFNVYFFLFFSKLILITEICHMNAKHIRRLFLVHQIKYVHEKVCQLHK